MELSPMEVRDAGELERSTAEFAQSSNGILLQCMTPLLALSPLWALTNSSVALLAYEAQWAEVD
jgi:hypothetical protein